MLQKVQDRKKVNAFVFLFAATYMISYITRTNFGAIVSEMQTTTGISTNTISHRSDLRENCFFIGRSPS